MNDNVVDFTKHKQKRDNEENAKRKIQEDNNKVLRNYGIDRKKRMREIQEDIDKKIEARVKRIAEITDELRRSLGKVE